MSLRVLLAMLVAVAACVALSASSALAASDSAPGAVVAADDDATAAQDDSTTGGTEDRDCVDFTFQEDAQVVLDDDTSDPFQLDEDGDGIACEDLPSNADPSGGVQTGGGGTAGVPGPPTAAPAGLVLVALLGAAGALALVGGRRSHRP